VLKKNQHRIPGAEALDEQGALAAAVNRCSTQNLTFSAHRLVAGFVNSEKASGKFASRLGTAVRKNGEPKLPHSQKRQRRHHSHRLPRRGKSCLEKEGNVTNAPRAEIEAQAAEECRVTLDGARMRYLRGGSGPALVLLHGLLGYSFSWRLVMPALSAQSTVYAVDMLGTGFSERPRGLDCSLRASAERLLRFADEAGLSSFDLLGTSHGGAVALRAAILAPARVRRLILSAPVNPWSKRGRWLAPFLGCRPVSALFLALAPFMEIAHEVLLRRLYGDTRRIPPGTLEGYAAPLKIPGSFQYPLSVLRSWRRDLRELESELPRIAEMPTLLLWGSEDRAVDPASAQVLRRHFQRCQLRVFDSAGHLPYEEMPEQFNRAVSEFLAQASAGTTTPYAATRL